MGCRVRAAAIGAVKVDRRRGAGPQNGRSSRTYTHNRPVRVRPRPGSSTGTGVSSAWIFSAANTWLRIPSTIGCSSPAV